MAELLPCPFCGKQPKWWWDNEPDTEGFNIDCCHVRLGRIFKSEAIEAWNSRVGD